MILPGDKLGYKNDLVKGEKVCNAMNSKVRDFYCNVKGFCKEKKRGEKA